MVKFDPEQMAELDAQRMSECSCGELSEFDEQVVEEATIRIVDDEEFAKMAPPADPCLYSVLVGDGRCPQYRQGDYVCIWSCPASGSCPRNSRQLLRVRIVNASGTTVCKILLQSNARGTCATCPGSGHRFVWV